MKEKTSKSIDFQNLYIDFLTAAGKMSFYEVTAESIFVKNLITERQDLLRNIGKDGEYILSYYNKVEEEILNFERYFKLNEIGKSLNDEYFTSLRNEISDFINCLNSYSIELSYCLEMFTELIRKESISEETDQDMSINYNRLFDDIYDFIMEDEDTLQDKISTIIQILPFRMSRYIYYDFVKNALLKYLKDSSKTYIDDYINELKNRFNGTLNSQYGKKFHYYFNKIQEYRNFDFKSADVNELKVLNEDANKLYSEILDLTILISLIAVMINKLIVIEKSKEFLIKALDKEEVKKLIEQYKFVISDKNSSKEEELFFTCNKEAISGIKYINKAAELLDKVEKLIEEKHDNEYIDIYKKLIEIFGYLNNNGINEVKGFEIDDIKPASSDYLDQAVDNFIKLIDQTIKNMSNLNRKVRMRRLLSYLEEPFSDIDEFFKYIQNSFETNTSSKDIQLALSDLADLMFGEE